jgi:hypothetical protein
MDVHKPADSLCAVNRPSLLLSGLPHYIGERIGSLKHVLSAVEVFLASSLCTCHVL